MKNRVLKTMVILLLFVISGCQEEEIGVDLSSKEIKDFIKMNDLKVLDESTLSEISFENMEEAQLFIDEIQEAAKSVSLPFYKRENVFKDAKPSQSTSRVATIREDVQNVVLYDSFFVFGFNIEADVRYSYCTGNGAIVNDPSTISINSYLTGFSLGLTWVPTSQIAFLDSPLNKIDYIVTGRLIIGFEYEGISLGLPINLRFDNLFFGNPHGSGDGSGDCNGSSNDGGNDNGGNNGGNYDDWFHEGHPGGCPPGHEVY